MASAASGPSLYKGASFLVGKLGQKVASANVTLVDDARMLGGPGSKPFDGEGLRDQSQESGREGRAENLSARQLFGAQAETRADRQCLALGRFATGS